MADIRISVVKFTTRTTTGNQTITGDLGGATPKAALFFTTSHTLAGDPGSTGNLIIGIGATDGASQWCCGGFAADNASTSNTSRFARTTACLTGVNSASAEFYRAAFSSFGADSITINFDVATATGRECICVLFGGADFSAKVGTTGTSNSSVSGLSFAPTAVLFGSFNNNFTGTAQDDCHLGFGAAVDDGSLTNRSMDYYSDDASANENSRMYFSTAAYGRTRNTTGDLQGGGAVTAFASDGFTYTVTANGSGYLALGGVDAKLVTFTTPTSTGNSTITTTGITPFAVIGAVTSLNAADTDEIETANSTGGGFFAFTASEDGAISFSADDDADPTNTNNDCKAHALMGGIGGTGPQAIVADFTSFQADGFTLNYTTVNATSRYGWALAFGSAGDAGGGDETGLSTGETGETGDGVLGDSIFKSRIFHSPILNGYGVFR